MGITVTGTEEGVELLVGMWPTSFAIELDVVSSFCSDFVLPDTADKSLLCTFPRRPSAVLELFNRSGGGGNTMKGVEGAEESLLAIAM